MTVVVEAGSFTSGHLALRAPAWPVGHRRWTCRRILRCSGQGSTSTHALPTWPRWTPARPHPAGSRLLCEELTCALKQAPRGPPKTTEEHLPPHMVCSMPEGSEAMGQPPGPLRSWCSPSLAFLPCAHPPLSPRPDLLGPGPFCASFLCWPHSWAAASALSSPLLPNFLPVPSPGSYWTPSA